LQVDAAGPILVGVMGKVMKDLLRYEWNAEFEGHQIRADFKCSIFPPKKDEVLEIDGIVVEHYKSSIFSRFSVIKTKHDFNGIEHDVEIRFAQKTVKLSDGCQILIDGHQINSIKTISDLDLKKDEEVLKKGFFRYFLKIGLLYYGLPFGIVQVIILRKHPIPDLVSGFVTYFTFFGLCISYVTWRGIKSRVNSRKDASK